MKAEDSQLLWKYLDGDCSTEEQQLIKQKLEEDNNFREEWLERKMLHESFQAMETEAPSMRFAANVMDNLPQLYQRATLPPLVRPFWTRAFTYSIIASTVILLIISILSPTGAGEGSSRWLLPEVKQIGDLFNVIPNEAFVLIASVSMGAVLLLWVDQMLKRRFNKNFKSAA